MHIRDAEIKRLLLYGKSLGVKIVIRDYAFEEYGNFSCNPLEICINKRRHNSKTELILTLMHELAHVRFHILSGRPLSEGWLQEDDRKPGQKIAKKLRKEIADFETESLELMTNIATDLNIKVPMKKILRQKELDQFVYSHYYKVGEFPTEKEKKAKQLQLKEKYK
jgi:hypothetical protein